MSKPKAYTRVSTLCKAISDTTAITDWKCRQVALGMAQRPDLSAVALSAGDDRRALGDVVKQALAASAADRAANTGTAIHSMTEAADRGHDLSGVPAEYRRLVDSYRATMESFGVEVLAAERFIVNDDLEAAGTFDRLVRIDGQLVVADIKTGAQAPKYAMETAAQVATYAQGSLYTLPDPDAEIPRDRWGRPLIESADSGNAKRVNLAELGVSQTAGLLIHLPQGGEVCDLYWLDLGEGYWISSVARDVRRMRKGKYAAPVVKP